jgi:hypothetical protein
MHPLLFGFEDTGLDDYRSDYEREFLEALYLRAKVAGWAGDAQAWALAPYLIVTVDLLYPETNVVHRTLRVDFDGSSVVVGYDPTLQLVGDLDRTRPDVYQLSGCSIPEMAAFAADWIESELANS